MSHVITYPREAVDWRGFTLTLRGQIYAGAWSYQITTKGARPTGSWTPAVLKDGQNGVDIPGPVTAGYYWIHFRPTGQGSYDPRLDPIDLVRT